MFDDTFSTVPYMRAASLPLNWEELVKNSSEIATNEEFDLAESWSKDIEDGKCKLPVPKAGPSSSKITDPFAIVPDQNLDSGLSPVQTPSVSE